MRQGAHRISERRVLVAEDHRPGRIPFGEKPREGNLLRDGRQAENAALFGGLDGIGAHPLEVDARGLRASGHHGPDGSGSHLHGLLHDVIQPGVFERREKIVQFARGGLRAGPHVELDRHLFAAGRA